MSCFEAEYDRAAVADTGMLQCSAQFRILFINAIFVADNASHALASSATVGPTFNIEEEVIVIRNGLTPKEDFKSGSIPNRCGWLYHLKYFVWTSAFVLFAIMSKITTGMMLSTTSSYIHSLCCLYLWI